MTKEAFYRKLYQSEYGQKYLQVLQESSYTLSDYSKGSRLERHHIHPRALGGDVRDITNLVVLSIPDHIKAHYYLALIFQRKMLYAFNMLTNRTFKNLSELEKVVLEDLEEWATVRYEAAHRKHTPEEVEKIRAGQAGKRVHIWTEEERKRLSERRKGQRAWNKGIKYADVGVVRTLSPGGLEAIREAGRSKKGKVKVLDPTTGKVSLIQPGELNTFLELGYVRSGGSTKQKGSIHIHRACERKMISREELQQYLDEGWEVGRGIPAPNKGKPHSEETKKKMSERAVERFRKRKI